MEFEYIGDLQETYDSCVLHNSLDIDDLCKHYIDSLNIQNIIFVELYNIGKKTPKKYIKSFWEDTVPELIKLGIKNLLVTDAEYFKHIIKDTKAESWLGIKCVAEGFNVFYIPSYKGLFYNHSIVSNKINIALQGIKEYLVGSYIEPGSNIIHSEEYYYPIREYEAKEWLKPLLCYPALTCDIETTGLKYHDSHIFTIGLAWDQHNGVVFDVRKQETLRAFKWFFENYKGKLIFHNAAFDVTYLIYHLWMLDIHDPKRMLEGLEVMTRNLECTQVMAYLCLNSCAGNELGLKVLAQEFAGNYAEDVSDIFKIPWEKLLEYNLKDCLSTWYVRNKYDPKLDIENQREIFNIFMEWMKDIIQMQLTGMPINLDRVEEVETEINLDFEGALMTIHSNKYVKELTDVFKGEWVLKRNSELKVKRVSIDDADIEFNPGSSQQLARLLYDLIELPVLELTDSKQPATGKKVIKTLKNHTQDPEVLELLDALESFKDAEKILTAFIPAFKEAPYSATLDCHMLLGNFRLGGTKSGRLSSNNINLQQLPSGGKYGKLIKSCFQAPEGFLFIGLDFDSLEDRISALYTKDPQKLKVYTDGFDGHSLRALSYFGDQMEGIDPNSVESVNSIAVKYPLLRQEGKAPTFACTYGGTYRTMMKNLGWSEEKSRSVENRFNELYAVSVQVIADKIKQACTDGFVTGAFGLRLRTPILERTIRGTKATPREAEAEARTAGNMLGQSYCMLNSRAANDFMNQVRASEYKYGISLCAQIHDASYYLIPADAKILKYVNDNLVKAAYWQDLPEIYHPDVPLGGSLGVFYPSWAKEHTVKQYASLDEILEFGEVIANG